MLTLVILLVLFLLVLALRRRFVEGRPLWPLRDKSRRSRGDSA